MLRSYLPCDLKVSFNLGEMLFHYFFNFLIRVYLLYMGDSLWQFLIGLYCSLVRSPHLLSPTTPQSPPLPTPLKAIARGFYVLFHISIWSPSMYTLTLISFSHRPAPTSTTPTLFLFYSPVLLLIFKLVTPYFQQLSVHISIYIERYTFIDVMYYDIVDALSFSFSFPTAPSSRVVPLLWTFYRWVCIWSCLFFLICLSFWSIFHIWEKTCGLWLLSLPYFN
jgi:hypothetical protein